MSEEGANARRRSRAAPPVRSVVRMICSLLTNVASIPWERCFTLSYDTLTSGAQCMKVSVSIEDTTSKHHSLGRCVPLSCVSYALQEHRVQGPLNPTKSLTSLQHGIEARRDQAYWPAG
jgi:hypothetical protein